MRKHHIIKRTYTYQLNFLKRDYKINSSTNGGSSEGPETSAQQCSTRQIQSCLVDFCWDPFSRALKNKKQKMDNTNL